MKKLILAIALILFTSIGYSQDFYKITYMTQIEYVNGKWTPQETMPVTADFYMLMEGNRMILTGLGKKYMCVGDSKDEIVDNCHSYAWDGYDQDGDKCFIILVNCFNDPQPKTMAVTIGYETNGRAIKFDLDPNYK